MTANTPSSESIEQLVNDTIGVMDLMASVPHCSGPALEDHRNRCREIPGFIRSGRLKVAVVGVIKSGKSTFINSLVKKELVKRGAGAMTSITTRIRKGKKNRAFIYFKSWDQINLSLERILDLFPQKPPEDRFDLRRKKDREFLGQVFNALEQDFPVTDEGLRPEALMIRNALDGYEVCRREIQADETSVCFEGNAFAQHQVFTADPARAFYVKDVLLEVYGKTIDPGIEIADCQGADSTDPAQISQILSYIRGANLIVYCISSRTGLRQSDITFLKTIRRMGLMGNVLFVNNCDLTEHDHIDDLKRIEAAIERELAYLTPNPELFSFSALYTLFDSMPRLSARNAARLDLWKSDPAMSGYCSRNTARFMSAYETLLDRRRYHLLHANHLERLRITAKALQENARLVSDLLVADMDGQVRAKAQLSEVEENARRLKVIVDNSIQGAVTGLTMEIESNLTEAFLKDSVSINKKLSSFIKAAKLDVEPYRAGVKETGFKQILYLMFQDFKRQLDMYTVEEIIPELDRLVAAQEKRIEAYFQSLLDSYRIDLPSLGNTAENETLSLPSLDLSASGIGAVDITGVKKILGLSLPDQILSVRFSTRMKTNALTDLGLHSIVLFISALLDRQVRFSFTPGFNKAALKIKKETLTMARQQIRAYHSTLKQAYFTPLIAAVTRDFKEKILDHFNLYDAVSQDMEEIFTMDRREKLAQLEKLEDARKNLAAILSRLEAFLPGNPEKAA